MTASRMRAVLALILSFAAVSPALATSENPWTFLSPWTLNRSGYYFQTTMSYRSTEEFYDFEGVKQSSDQYKELTTNLHLEYGLRNSVGLMFGVPVRHITVEQPAPPDLLSWGIGDLTGGARFRIATDPVTASAQAEIKLPTGYNAYVQKPPLGEGQVDYTGRLLVGMGLPAIHGFAQAAGGYKYRTDGAANQFLFNADAGSWLGNKTMLEGHWEWLKHTGDKKPYDQFQGGVTARYRALRLFDFLGGVFQTFGGQNAQAGTQFFLGFTTRGNRLSKVEGPMAATLAEEPLPPLPPPGKAGVKPDTTAAPRPVPQTPAVPDTLPQSPGLPDTTTTPKH